MKNTSLFFASVLLSLSLCLLPANRGAAQASDPFGGGGGGGARKKVANTAPVALQEVRFDVEFVDTPAPEAFQFMAMKMEDLGADPLNIVYSKAAEAITLPTMTLRQITFEQFVSFINRIGGELRPIDEGGDDPFGDGRPYFPEHTGPRFGISDNDGIWYFWAEESALQKSVPGGYAGAGGANGGFEDEGGMEMAAGGGAPEMTTRFFALDEDSEPILGLIEEALAETQRHSKRPQPSLKFHEPSSTLIVSGSMTDLNMIDEVINAMQARNERKLRQENEKLAYGMADEINALKRELEFSKRMAEEEKVRLSARAEQEIAILQTELAEARRTYTDTHPKIVELQAQLEKALEELKKKK